ncbi:MULTISPECIES: FdhF/YdeP family oxidoreductase [Microbacterium]|uniref:Putative formate dehydrogenase n=1 Tax=Microbacterium trichothecenolyticum TaxID=69370 RepID=A0A0M2H5B9_MICTR|nr:MULTISPECIES: FdhF/YdeP family oxidoreductase [Microbacterium]KJL41521.1 putative formate dehydrogenase [Microbacterium trichothecenolyticum]MDR7190596.1 molybdopterin-dependent oxidoreductase alpha subunit [Microbacterium sp. BE35]
MATKPPTADIDETRLRASRPKKVAVGVPAVLHALEIANEQMGVMRSVQTLMRVNQKDGFDCPGCAWPEEDKRHIAEFCENGAKAVAEEATLRRVGPEFFAAHSLDELRAHDDWWLGQQGRLTHPMVLDEGASHYRPISWDDALSLVADELKALDDPDEAVFYTSGRTSNEAAFLYQLLVRGLGTNNLPDCSNMCHESSGSALTETIGIGKGTVSIEDVHEADLLIVAGQNPGTNHPRMLSALEKAKRRGATIIAVNPLPEAGLMRFENPQTVRGVAFGGTKLADEFVQIRLGGDQALFQAIGKHLLEAEASDGGVLDHDFIAAHTSGFDAYRQAMTDAPWRDLVTATGLPEKALRRVGEAVRTSKATIVCWAMGLTQHKHSVPTLREVVNVLLLQGNIGRPGAGVCPVRGHSNVQGDRTVGIYEKPSAAFLDALDAEFGFAAPREHGFDTVQAIRAMRDGQVRFFMSMGGNFVSATPDTAVVEAGMARVGLTVHVSTKLNRSHVVTGRRALILPTLGRTDRDRRGGREQRVTVEDSMGAVHSSRGRLAPPSEELLSEVAIVARLSALIFGAADAAATAPRAGEMSRAEDDFAASAPPVLTSPPLVAAARGSADPGTDHGLPEHGAAEGERPDPVGVQHPSNVPQADWAALEADYALIRSHIERVVPGFDDYEERIDKGRTLHLPNGPRDARRFATVDGRARFTVNRLEYPVIPRGRLLLQTLRSHDQYNTTIYGKDDRYRGIHGGRRVVLVNAKDIVSLGFTENDVIDLVSEWTRPDGTIEERRAEEFRIVAYRTPRGNAAAYYPETNVLVPLDSVADVSGTPTSKSVIVRLERRA